MKLAGVDNGRDYISIVIIIKPFITVSEKSGDGQQIAINETSSDPNEKKRARRNVLIPNLVAVTDAAMLSMNKPTAAVVGAAVLSRSYNKHMR
ncbi:unnamed protein product [Hermetia illucens]|uniref:Uncharacterized protein n=1 Tax=Hermetia illucens TaxID=343691 RepID=A0A7R8Z3B1_HERIL|nr:unnamed protein product [Hermetia illucens]